MQYKVMKDYKKILEGVVNIINTAEKSDIGFANICTYIGENCPEFKESDDDRMVKFIKNHLFNIKKTITENYELDAKLTKAICWIEKQGVHAKFINGIQVGDKVTRSEYGVLVNLSQLNRVANKQVEQNLLYVNDNAKEMFIKALERVEEQNKKGYKLTDCDKNSWWEDFKAYTSCIIEHKPAWSEEDERNLQGIIDEIEVNKNDAPDYDVATYNRFLSWLKSIKERYTWKPSEEQMNTLEYYMHTLICNEHKEVLFGLYADLKKLMEK